MDIDILIDCDAWQSALAEVEAMAGESAEAVAEAVALPAGMAAELSIRFSDDAAVRTLNRDWRGIDKATNVLSFVAETPESIRAGRAGMEAPPLWLGDLVLAYETVCREAEAQGKPLAHHLRHLLVHGLLHLFGFDHQEEQEAERMEAMERRVLARFGVPDPYAGEAGASASLNELAVKP